MLNHQTWNSSTHASWPWWTADMAHSWYHFWSQDWQIAGEENDVYHEHIAHMFMSSTVGEMAAATPGSEICGLSMEHHHAVSCWCMHTAHLHSSRQQSHLSEQLMQPRCQGLCWCFVWNSPSWQNVARQSWTLDRTWMGTNCLCYLQPECELGLEVGHAGRRLLPLSLQGEPKNIS